MQRNIQLLTAVLMVMTLGCETTTTTLDLLTADTYYPLEVGKTVVYRVDSISYYETIDNDTASWDLRETIVEAYPDNQGRINYRVERAISAPGANNWQISEIWSVLNNNGNIERTEQNLRFLRLISPVSEGAEWDGHVYLGDLSAVPVAEQCNNLEFLNGWRFTYRQVGAAASFNGLDFNNTLTVLQTGSQNLIEFNASEEVYAEGVGMVYRFFRHYTTQNICPECPWEANTDCGYSVKMTVIDYN